MMVIHKIRIDPSQTQYELPRGAITLKIHEQYDNIHLWYMFDINEKKKEIRRFMVYGTGHPIPVPEKSLLYVGTALLFGGRGVFHVFEEIHVEASK